MIRDEAGHLKVADFGLSRLLKTHATQKSHEIYQLTGETGSCECPTNREGHFLDSDMVG